ncbi:hypothetical protein CJF42_10995 [Pseudoalteromonas sp. NBT06-2]|uniref:ribosome recycling factor family protein n=1 Tax=Pseudoalteromonas sp. NBT06-2 TaxID=2025950 RepID=UPI000BA50C8F|nr:ribosome recycling factor family protein [Pseudoalteromonas sp. NBT06-2]PAJ74353.1 hypothetical protein CJF42_10995 [Pseudoalteromonas sp. NBT06-2]
MIEIPLNSFVRRTQDRTQLKVLVLNTGALLKRKGRSRNWILQADCSQISEILYKAQQVEEPSWQWFISELEKHKPQLSVNELVNLIKQEPLITLNQLIVKTDCTLAQAREAIDIVEWC